MEYKIRFNPEQRLTRIPKILAQTFGNCWILRPNSRAAIIYAEDADLGRVLQSLRFLQKELAQDVASKSNEGEGGRLVGTTPDRPGGKKAVEEQEEAR